MLIQPQKHFFQLLISISALLFFISCKKSIEESNPVNNNAPTNTNNNNNYSSPTGTTPDLSTYVHSSVSGFVSDENSVGISGATVQAGSFTATTDLYGHFEISNIQVVKTAAVVTIIKAGYFKAVKTFLAEEGKTAFFRVKLISKTIAGTINAPAGGNVSLPNGLAITLPANAVVNAVTNAAYTGSINVAATWINPADPDVNKIMPGDLRGIDTSGFIKGLTSYGMAAIELTGSSGELLQIAAGKKATITMPLSSTLTATAPLTIALWYFDESNGLWKEQGMATKTGNSYVGEVSHFSYWNFDVPFEYVPFNCTIVDGAGQPLQYMTVAVFFSNGPIWWSATGITDASGYTGFTVPANAQLSLNVYANSNCPGIYSQAITTTNTAWSAGTIAANVTSGNALVTGSVVDCNNNPVFNGYLILISNNELFSYPLGNAGAFNFSRYICSGSENATLIGVDNGASLQSAPNAVVLVPGAISAGNVQACSITTTEFLNYSCENGFDNFPRDDFPGETISYSDNGSITLNAGDVSFNHFVRLTFETNGIGVDSYQTLGYFDAMLMGLWGDPVPTSFVHITEYGPVGGYVSGNYSGGVMEMGNPGNVHFVSFNFRVRRSM